MAEKRMFAKTIIESDAFTDMPLSAQALYIHLSMQADDEGFVNNPRKLQRMIGAADDDLKILVAKKFVISFKSGVVAIKHWRMNNYIRNDRFRETVYTEEKAQLAIKENGSYYLLQCSGIPVAYHLPTNGIPNDDQRYTQYRIDKNSIEESRVEKSSIDKISVIGDENENLSDDDSLDWYFESYEERLRRDLTDEEKKELRVFASTHAMPKSPDLSNLILKTRGCPPPEEGAADD